MANRAGLIGAGFEGFAGCVELKSLKDFYYYVRKRYLYIYYIFRCVCNVFSQVLKGLVTLFFSFISFKPFTQICV